MAWMIGVRRDGVFDFLLKGILVFLLHLLGVEEVMLGARRNSQLRWVVDKQIYTGLDEMCLETQNLKLYV